MTLPPPADLVALVTAQGPSALDAVPGIDDLADTRTLAEWLGIANYRSIHRDRRPDRVRADGTRWPDPDDYYGRTPVWRYRTIVMYRHHQSTRKGSQTV